MIDRIFVGGYWGSGTRAIQYLLRTTHNTGSAALSGTPNVQEDYELGFQVERDHIVETALKGENFVWQLPPPPFSVKSGDLMLMIPELKKLEPDSKFILVVRNGCDQVINTRGPDIKFDKYFKYESTSCTH